MYPRRLLPFLLLGIAVIGRGATAGTRDVTKLYLDYCSGCHGPAMEGGKAGNLVDSKWQHGGDDASLLVSIQRGYPREGMPAFAQALSEAETRAMITYIRETATHWIDPPKGEESPLPTGVQHSEEADYRIEVVAEGLDVPWSFSFLPDDRILVTERVGRLRVIVHGKLTDSPICNVPKVVVKDEAGLMCVVADPEFAENQTVYLSFSDPGDDESSAMTKVIRAQLHDDRLENIETIFALGRVQYQKSFVLFGGRIAVSGPYLFFSVGERGMEDAATGQAQDLTKPVGKIHRVFRDGTIPPDNPFVGEADAWSSIWAYGVRNPQGLAIDRRNLDVWETEHGPRGGDELNRIERGKNYGWPVITSGMNYDGTPVSNKTEAPGMEQPVINWTPSIAVSQIEFYQGDKFPKWKDNLFIGSLAQQKLIRVVVEGGKELRREEVFNGLGRIRDIKTGPDGYLYLALELIGKPGRIVRLVPAN
ncbi:MAG: PQQ-dependent sugar dehydrogenase [Opitutus sp.]